MNEQLPVYDQGDELITDILSELSCLDNLLKNTLAKYKLDDSEDISHGIMYLEIEILRLKRYLQEAILSKQFDDNILIDEVIQCLRDNDFTAIDYVTDDYSRALEPYQPGTQVNYRLASSDALSTGLVINCPRLLLVPTTDSDSLGIRLMADIEINSDGACEYESFYFHRNSAGEVSLLGINPVS